MKFIKEAFGWSIYKLEGIIDYHYNEENIREYYIAINFGKNTFPIEGKTIGELLEKAAEVNKKPQLYENYRDVCYTDNDHY